MGDVEHVEAIGVGSATPTPAIRVPLGLGQGQKAMLWGAYFTFPNANGTLPGTFNALLSQNLRLLTEGIPHPYLPERSAIVVVHLRQDQATAVGFQARWLTYSAPLYGLAVYQDIVFGPGAQTDEVRVDVFFEKVAITRLEKATQLRQRKRQFEFRR